MTFRVYHEVEGFVAQVDDFFEAIVVVFYEMIFYDDRKHIIKHVLNDKESFVIEFDSYLKTKKYLEDLIIRNHVDSVSKSILGNFGDVKNSLPDDFVCDE